MGKKEYKGVNFVDNSTNAAGGFWFLGFLGAAIHFVSQVDGFGNVIWAILKAAVWPAYLVNKAFELLSI